MKTKQTDLFSYFVFFFFHWSAVGIIFWNGTCHGDNSETKTAKSSYITSSAFFFLSTKDAVDLAVDGYFLKRRRNILKSDNFHHHTRNLILFCSPLIQCCRCCSAHAFFFLLLLFFRWRETLCVFGPIGTSADIDFLLSDWIREPAFNSSQIREKEKFHLQNCSYSFSCLDMGNE